MLTFIFGNFLGIFGVWDVYVYFWQLFRHFWRLHRQKQEGKREDISFGG
jgi:hypothetical protein